MKVEGSVAIVTGGGRGMGEAHAKALLKKGAKVCVVDQNEQLGDQTVKQFRSDFGDEFVTFKHCDVTNKVDFENVFLETKDRFGQLDIVINNAGVVQEDDWERSIDINLKATFHGTLLGMKYMGRDKGALGGVVVNMASAAGLMPLTFKPAYVATKYAVVGLSRSFGSKQHYDVTGVRVNCLCPWFVDTPIFPMKPGQVYDHEGYTDFFKTLTTTFGIIKPDTVADGMISIVEDDMKNGEALVILQNSESGYLKFPEFKPDSMP